MKACFYAINGKLSFCLFIYELFFLIFNFLRCFLILQLNYNLLVNISIHDLELLWIIKKKEGRQSKF